MLRRIFLGLLVLVVVAAAALAIWEPLTAKPPAAPTFKPTDVQIARDKFGVPHIFGKTDADVAYGIAFAHAEDDFSTLQEVLAMTRGRAGAMLGAGTFKSEDTRQLVEQYHDKIARGAVVVVVKPVEGDDPAKMDKAAGLMATAARS